MAYTESPRMLAFMGLFVCKLIHWNARNDRDVAQEQSDEAESRLFLVFAGNVRPPKHVIWQLPPGNVRSQRHASVWKDTLQV